MRRLRAQLTYANVMSSIAVFVVLGGGAYAATTLPKNSVGSKQIKAKAVTSSKIASNSVTSAKVKDGSLLATDFKAGQLVAGAPGPAGAQGAQGAPGAKGDKGDPGRSALTPLRAGESESGVFGIGDQASAASQQFLDFRSFAIPLSAPLDSGHVVYVTGASAPNCPGAGQAAAGYLCVYEATSENAAGQGIYTEAGAGGASVRGFVVSADSSAIGQIWFGGTYTVTGS
jgi:hypothetical protein